MRAALLVGAWLVTVSTFAADVTSYFVSKGNIYTQTNSGPPHLHVVPWIFHARVTTPNINLISEATVSHSTFLDGLTPRATNYWTIIRSFSAQSGFNPFFPDTNWVLAINTANDGWKTNHLPLFVSSYPAAPHIANYATAQSVDPSADFTLTWDAWPGASPGNLVSLVVFHRKRTAPVVFQTSTRLGDATALPGTATSIVIPAGTFETGRVYLARLRFDQIIATNLTNYPGVPGFSSSFASTDFYIKTLGANDDTAPRIAYVSPQEGAVVVSTISPVTWVFSKPMLTNSVSYQFPNVDFRRAYSPERFIMTFTPTNGTYSPSTQIRWRLNLWDDHVALADVDGNPLLPERFGTFLTGTTTNLPPAPIPPRFTNSQALPGQFTTRVEGETNRSYLILSKTNLNANPTNWSFVTVGHASDGSAPFATNTTSDERRFFRAIALP